MTVPASPFVPVRLAPFLPLLLLAVSASAQPLTFPAGTWRFGSADDPLETQRASFGRSTGVVAAYAGPAFLGSAWRVMTAVEAEGRTGPLSVGLGGALHSGVGGFYDPEVDEAYDLARLLRYARLDPRPGLPVYARLGPTRRMTFGTGHLVRGYRTTTAWDERTVGLEAAVASPGVTFGAFTGDVRMSDVAGAYAEVEPFGPVRVGLGVVHDFSPPSDAAPTGFQVDASAEALRLFEFVLAPYASYAEYLHYGRGVGFGADVGAPAFADLARLHLRLGAFVNGDGFTPGYVGPFYAVSNGEDRIVTADSFFGEGDLALAGTPLGEVEGGLDVVTEFELVFFRAFELFYHFRRHYGDQDLSDFTLRAAFRPRFVDGLRVELGLDRQGLGSFFSLFRDLRDQNTLVFDIDYPVGDLLHVSIRSRYGYRRLEDAEEGARRFLVQRRFEPLVGVRYRF